MKKEIDARTLVLPAGVRIAVGDKGFRIGNEGDVVILGALEEALDEVTSSEGSITLHAKTAMTLDRIEAAHGTVELAGDLTVQTVHARTVVMVSGKLSAGAIVAEESIVLSGDVLAADVLATPRVDISEQVRGRATVIESLNELGPHRLKGGFRLEEYLELFPAGEQILERYPEVKDYLDQQASEGDATEAGTDTSLDSAGDIPELEPSSLETADHGDKDGEVLTLTDAVDTAGGKPHATTESLAEGAGDELYQRLSEAYLKVMGCYTDTPLPPPLKTLEGMLEARAFKKLKKRITSLWNELLQYHRREGLDVANTVTHNIQKMTQILQDRV